MKWFRIAIILLAMGIGIVPHFTDCYSQEQVLILANGRTQPMKCHWTAQAEIAVAAPLVGIGAMMVVSRRKETLRNLSVAGIISGFVVIALPLSLIGTCTIPTHFCNTAMKPSLLALASLAIVSSLGITLLARKAKD